jgi:MoaA/NifB/PqqE/SkfB family radical SAM enzyme
MSHSSPHPLSNKLAAAKSYLNPQQVGYLILFVTNRCNFRCPFCFYYAEIEKNRKPDELTLEEIQRLAQGLGPLLQLSLTGGEPFLRKDLAEIYRVFIEQCQVPYITIPTNASLPEKMVAFLEQVLPAHPTVFLRLVFSIEAVGQEHDRIRNMPGSYDKIVDSYRKIAPLRKKYPNLVLDANSVFTAQSEGSLKETIRHLDEEFEFDNLSITYARGDIQDPELQKTSMEKYLQVNGFLESLSRKKEHRFLYPVLRGLRDLSREILIKTAFKEEFVVPCVAGRKLVVVGETGEVIPCEILGKTLGNLRDFDFDIKRLLAEKKNRALCQWIVESQCKCTWECALAANIVWNYRLYPKLLVSSLRNIGQKP